MSDLVDRDSKGGASDRSRMIALLQRLSDIELLERFVRLFASDPTRQTHRFRVNKSRRQHLHRQIEGHGLDMTHVTERKGSPQTLVCTKTRHSYLRRSAEYRRDIAALTALAELLEGSTGECASHFARIAAARERVAASAE